MEYQEQPMTQPEELVLDMLRENVAKNELSYAFLHWKDDAGAEQVSVVVAGPHDERLFAEIEGLRYTNPEEFAIDICTLHPCVGPEFLIEAAVICCGDMTDGASLKCLKAPGMNAISNRGRFYAICSKEASLVDGITPETVDYIKGQQH